MAKEKSTTPKAAETKAFTSEDATRKIRELIGGMIGISSKSIKVKPNYKLQKPELDIPGFEKLTDIQKAAVAKADELLGLVILS